MFKKALKVLGVLFVVALPVWFYLDRTGEAQWQARLDKIRAQGDPASLKELMANAHAPLPDKGAGGKIIAFKYELDPKKSFTVPSLPKDSPVFNESLHADADKIWAGWSPEMQAQVQQTVDANRALLDKAHALAGLPLEERDAMLHNAGKDKDYFMSYRIPNLLATRGIANLLTLEAILAAKTGKPDVATACVADQFRWAAHMRNDCPTLITEMITVALTSIAAKNVPRLAEAVEFPADSVRTLHEVIQRVQGNQGLVDGFKGERLSMLDIHRYLTEGASLNTGLLSNRRRSWDAIGGYLYGTRPFRFMLNRDILAGLDILDESIRLAALPHVEAQAGEAALQDMARQNQSWIRPISSIMIPNLMRSNRQEGEGNMQLGIARLVLALKQYRAANGAYPDKLEQLKPAFIDAIPPDMWTGKDPIYRREDNGFLLYSVGENKKDDGGKEQQDEKRLGASLKA